MPLSPRPRAAVGRTNPTSKEPWLHGRRGAESSYHTLKVRKGGSEEISLTKVRSNCCALLEQL